MNKPTIEFFILEGFDATYGNTYFKAKYRINGGEWILSCDGKCQYGYGSQENEIMRDELKKSSRDFSSVEVERVDVGSYRNLKKENI